MSQFTDSDRERAQKTLTLVEQQGKLNDERYEIIREQHQEFKDKFIQHDERISKGEGFRNRLIGLAVGSGFLSVGVAEFIRSKIGI